MIHWNKAFVKIMEIKEVFNIKFPELKNLKLSIEEMCARLNNEGYNSFIEPLQFVYYEGYKDNDMFVLIRYGLQEMQKGLWEDTDSIYRYCRSLVINLTKNEVVLAPMKKFFNLNEVEETSIENISKKMKTNKIEITNKLDGSMQNFTNYNNELFGSGSQALDRKNSWRLDDGYNMVEDNQVKMIMENPEYTFIFEFISLKDNHVVRYKEEEQGMYLIGIVNKSNGHELSYESVNRIARLYNSLVVEIETINFDKMLEMAKEIKSNEKEGWVVKIGDLKFKVKGDDYVKLHRILDKISSINVVIEACAENKVDDLISKLPDGHRERIQKIVDEIFEKKLKAEKDILEVYNEIIGKYTDKKSFMIYVKENIQTKYAIYLRQYYLTKELNWLKIGQRYKKYDEI